MERTTEWRGEDEDETRPGEWWSGYFKDDGRFFWLAWLVPDGGYVRYK